MFMIRPLYRRSKCKVSFIRYFESHRKLASGKGEGGVEALSFEHAIRGSDRQFRFLSFFDQSDRIQSVVPLEQRLKQSQPLLPGVARANQLNDTVANPADCDSHYSCPLAVSKPPRTIIFVVIKVAGDLSVQGESNGIEAVDCGLSSEMRDCEIRSEQDGRSRFPDPPAEIGIFVVVKELLVETAQLPN